MFCWKDWKNDVDMSHHLSGLKFRRREGESSKTVAIRDFCPLLTLRVYSFVDVVKKEGFSLKKRHLALPKGGGG